jgi:hypothetical protein
MQNIRSTPCGLVQTQLQRRRVEATSLNGKVSVEMPSSASLPHSDGSNTFTARAVLVGVLLTAFYAWFNPITRYVHFSSDFDSGVLSPGVVFLGIVAVVGNWIVSKWRPSWTLNPGELVVVFGMVWLGAASNQIGMIGNFLSVMSGVSYFSSPENRWADYYLAYLPAWVTPSDASDGIRSFYNGLPQGRSIPWGIWVAPLFWWGSLVIATVGMTISLTTLLHEQWHNHEKLTFPMADIPLGLIGADSGTGRRGVPSWMRSRLFWYGAAIPFTLMVWNIIHFIFPLWPKFTFSQIETQLVFRHLPSLYTKVDWFTIGLAYFAPIPVLLGLWLGRVLIAGEIGFINRVGVSVMNAGYMPWSEWSSQLIAWQCFGSLFVFVVWGLWTGREHFTRVLASAVGGGKALTPALRRRYRTGVWGLIGCLAYMGFWFNSVGMVWYVVVMFLIVLVILTIGISKLMVESCLVLVDSPVNAQSAVLQVFGSANIPQASMAALVMTYVVFRSNMGLMLPQVAFASRMGDEKHVPRGRLYGALGLAVLVTIVIAVGTTIYLAYETGALNFQSHAFRRGHVEAYKALASAADVQFGPDLGRIGFMGAGAVLMLVVLAIRMQFAGFWLHPVGLVFATTSVASLQMLNFLIAWIAKSTLSRIGGHRLVTKARPFFLGLIAGHAVGLAVGIVTDMIFHPGAGHDIPTGW